MKSQLKINQYKLNLIKDILSRKTFFLFQCVNSSEKKNSKLKSIFAKESLTFCKVDSTLIRELIKETPLKNMTTLIEGSIILSYFVETKKEYSLKDLLKLNESIFLLGLKNQKHIYSLQEVKNSFLQPNYNKSRIQNIQNLRLPNKKLCLVIKTKTEPTHNL